MRRFTQIGTLVLLCCSPIAACPWSIQQDQKPAAPDQQSTPNAQSAAPDQNSSPEQAPAQVQPSTPPEQQQTAPPEEPTQANPEEPKSASKITTAHRNVVSKKKKRTGAQTGPQSNSGKVVVRNGGAKDNSVQLSPEMSQEQALHSRENTAQLLSTTDQNLQAIDGHQLSAAQQSMLDQIRAYVRQSKTASASGDLARAHTLAYKAHLLSDELARK